LKLQISSLTGLEEFYASWTGLTSLSGDMGGSTSLNYVDLSHNAISSVSGSKSFILHRLLH